MTSYAPSRTELLEEASAHLELSRRHLEDFCYQAYPGFQSARHHRAIIDALEAVERGDIRRVILQVPPRHGKSTIASHLFPPWYLGRDPNRRIIACSYGADLAYDFSRKARNTITSGIYRSIFPEVGLAPDARAVGQWELVNPIDVDEAGRPAPYKGGYVAAGVGGGIVGRGAHLAIIDDPVKNPKEATSPTVLESVWSWYTAALRTRLEGVGAIVIIMTRWAEEDLAGRVLQGSQGEDWHVVDLPAIAEGHDALGREPGDALWPEKFPIEELEALKIEVGSADFEALYQQRPTKPGGNTFKREWWKRYGAFDRAQAQQVIQVWDTAFKAKERNDFSVCSTWALMPQGAYILDVFRHRIEFPELKRAAKDLYAQYRPVVVCVEDRASGQSLIQELQRDTNIPVLALPADSDKTARAVAVTPIVEAGRVFLPEDAPWVHDWIEEHAQFPNGAHDDQVDTTSMALRRLFPSSAITGNRVAVSGPRPQIPQYTGSRYRG